MKKDTLQLLKGSKDIESLFKTIKYKRDFNKEHPDYFQPSGMLTFCGGQGSGKTLSAVQYVQKLMEEYPKAILVSNVELINYPFDNERIFEYDGVHCLTDYENGEYGVIYLIDEIHLEFNSLESANISIEEMVEISQQRKQRKHIIGTSQIYGRMAKPLREQIRWCVMCNNLFNLGVIQYNQLIDGFETEEKDGKITASVKKKYWWFHSPDLYKAYDTYAKMKRYKTEWRGRKVSEKILFSSQNSLN